MCQFDRNKWLFNQFQKNKHFIIIVFFRVDQQHMVLSLKQNFTRESKMERSLSPVSKNMTSTYDTTSVVNETLSLLNLTTSNASSYEKLLDEATTKSQFTINLYSAVTITSIIFAFIETYAIFDYGRRASVNIHKSMVKNIMDSTMSFFDTHFIGNIINRFSQDMNNIDEQLPSSMREVVRVRTLKL